MADEIQVHEIGDGYSLLTGINPVIEGIVKSLGGVKSSKGWTLSNDEVPKVLQLQSIYKNQAPPSHNPKSRYNQRKYRRECSDIESSGDESDSSNESSDSSHEDLVSPPQDRRRNVVRNKNIPRMSVDPSLLLGDSSSDSSDSDYDSSSDSDFPEGSSPRNHIQEYREVVARRKRAQRDYARNRKIL